MLIRVNDVKKSFFADFTTSYYRKITEQHGKQSNEYTKQKALWAHKMNPQCFYLLQLFLTNTRNQIIIGDPASEAGLSFEYVITSTSFNNTISTTGVLYVSFIFNLLIEKIPFIKIL